MKGGENVADFERVFRENREFVYRYLRKLSGNEDLAEELTQETFYRAFMNLSGLRREDRVSVWLCQIAKNTYFAWYREQKKLLPLEAAQARPDGKEPAELYALHDLSAQALRALHSLGEPYREVFLLAVYAQVSMKEISALFGKSESWARVTFYRAKQKLMEEMR